MTQIATSVSQLFEIKYPIIQGGMIWVSGWRLAAAVSNAGGLGLLGSGSMNPQLLDEHLTKLQKACVFPFGVNIPVNHPSAPEFVELAITKSVKAVFTSAGSPNKFTKQIQEAGIKVAHVVPSVKLALKAQAAGCDAVVAEGTEAGGHNGFEELTSSVLWPAVADAVQIPTIAAGGIIDGRSMVAAIALGAQGVQMGTRFAITHESSASKEYKKAVIESQEGDAKLYLRRFMPTRALVNPYVQRVMDAEVKGATIDELKDVRGRGRTRTGIFEGDTIGGELEVGQAAGQIDEILFAGAVVREVVDEYDETIRRLSSHERS